MSVRGAAKLASISEGRWRQLEAGHQQVGGDVRIPVRPRGDTLARVARALDADEGWLRKLAGLPEVVRSLPARRVDTSSLTDLELSRRLLSATEEAARLSGELNKRLHDQRETIDGTATKAGAEDLGAASPNDYDVAALKGTPRQVQIDAAEADFNSDPEGPEGGA